MPPFGWAGLASDVSVPDPLKTGWDGAPSARTFSWPGKMSDTAGAPLGDVVVNALWRITVTVSPALTHSTGPGCWKGLLPSENPHM